MRKYLTLTFFSSKATAERSLKRRSLIHHTLTSEECSGKKLWFLGYALANLQVFFALQFRQCKIRKKCNVLHLQRTFSNSVKSSIAMHLCNIDSMGRKTRIIVLV